MKPVLIIALAATALAGAAAAQPAWRPPHGGPPDADRACSHDGQDRCPRSWDGEGGYGHDGRHAYRPWRRHHAYGYRIHFRRRHHARGDEPRYWGHSSTDGERG